ncbi:MFS transporter [Pseudoteredinibacter isoporae]|uniref:Putative MFS family arabinose efflux permease n=1 Tax=Pseudoteredinibacter isoporae TaxID=570281 RepID=A0A7X0JR17_9GAMM|nr:MFS transporter [Pseudoteredinibacter isoporae]MBB6520214.1 putative MFS family arabinose efflux permease [Pseudoteredinibacter isoporae]NHO85786.1 MFS transporter [Pseudoteredinibacter isoporae]NIB25762.1 MFS transporter [Pseudoteredinibacter isoporae]
MEPQAYSAMVRTNATRFLFSLIYSAGTLVYFALPVWGGLFDQEYGFSAAQIGWLLSADMTSNAIANVSARYWIHRFNWQRSLLTFVFVFVAANVACMFYQDFSSLMLLRYIAGFAGGAMVSIAVAGIASTENPDKDFGLALSLQVFLGGLLILSSSALVDILGAESMYIIISIPAALCIPLIHCLPAKMVSQEDQTRQASDEFAHGKTLYLVLAFTAIFLFFTGMNSLWSFAELIGSELGVHDDLIAISLSASLILSVAGSLLAAWMGGKTERLRAITLGTFSTILSVLALLFIPGGWLFFLAINIFNFGYNFIIPFQSGWVSKLDNSGKNIVMLPAIQGFGISLGPILAGTVAEKNGLLQITYLSAGFLLSSIVVFTALYYLQNRSPLIANERS